MYVTLWTVLLILEIIVKEDFLEKADSLFLEKVYSEKGKPPLPALVL